MSEPKERRVEVGVLGREESVENEITQAEGAILRGRSAM